MDLPLSTRHNAVYRLPDVFAVLVAMCEKGTFIKSAVSMLNNMAALHGSPRIPSQRWFIGMLSKLDPEEMDRRARTMFEASVAEMYRKRVIPRTIVLAIDLHAIPYLGKIIGALFRGGRRKGGSNRFETYMSAVAASLPYLPHMGIRIAGKGMAMADGVAAMVRDARKAGVEVKHVLLDRGFYSVAVMKALDALGVKFLMPVPCRGPIRRAVEEFKRKQRKRVSKHLVASRNDEFEVTLVIVMKMEVVRKGKDKGRRKAVYLVYATNMSAGAARRAVKKIPSEYKKRWSIETGYRCVEAIRARTKSNCVSARIFLFYFTMTANNVWALQNHEADVERARRRKMERARTRAQRRAAARFRGRMGGWGLRGKYDQNVLTAECMLDCWRAFVNEMIRAARCDRGAFCESPLAAVRAR